MNDNTLSRCQSLIHGRPCGEQKLWLQSTGINRWLWHGDADSNGNTKCLSLLQWGLRCKKGRQNITMPTMSRLQNWWIKIGSWSIFWSMRTAIKSSACHTKSLVVRGHCLHFFPPSLPRSSAAWRDAFHCRNALCACRLWPSNCEPSLCVCTARKN